VELDLRPAALEVRSSTSSTLPVADRSSRRSIARPLLRALRVVLIVVLVGAAIVVGLTRTEVGRDQIRQQVETAFNQRFEGRLSIGTLKGSLIDNFTATEVQLRAPSGRIVGTVDSIRATPRWANLLTAELSVQRLTLFRPHLSLRRDSSGHWNLSKTLRRTASSSPPDQPLDLSFADIVVQDGRLATTRQGPAPAVVEKEWLFDYSRTRATNIRLRASARRAGANGIVDIQTASFKLPSLSLDGSLRKGQVQRTDAKWSISGLDLSLGTTRLRGTASLRSERTSPNQRAFTLNLDRSRIDHDELRRLVPRLPLAATVTVEGELGGSLDRFRADDMTVTHNSSFATVQGTVSRTPESVRLDVRLSESQLDVADVRDVWPDFPRLPNPDLGPVTVEASLQGTIHPDRPRDSFDLETRLTAQSPHGAVRGSLRVARPQGTALKYDAVLDTENLDLAPVSGRSGLTSSLTGRFEARGIGGIETTDTLRSELSLSLSPSTLRGRPLESADAQVTVQGVEAQGNLTLRQSDGGRVYMKGSAEDLNAQPAYTGTVSSSGLDLSPLGRFPKTALNARVELQASGTEWSSLTGTAVLNVDPSSVSRGDSTITLPPHSATVHLANRETEQPRFQLSGSVANLTIDGTSLGRPLWTTAQNWAVAFRDALRQVRNKSAPGNPLSPERTFPAPSSTDRPVLRAESQSALARMPGSGLLDARAQVEVYQSEILHAWWPAFPRRADGLTADVRLSMGADSLYASGQFSAASLAFGGVKVDEADAEYELSGRFGAPLTESMQSTARVSAERVQAGGPPIMRPSVSLSYQNRTGTLQLAADSIGIADSLRLISDLRITPQTNELRLRRVSVNVDGGTWTNPSPASVRAYADQFVVAPFSLERPHPQMPALQRVTLRGILSSSPTDTLALEAANVYLPPFSRASGLPHLIGGNVNGTVQLRSGRRQPKVDGTLSVQRLSYDRRVLGDARLQAEYDAQSPDLLLRGSLGMDSTSVDSLAGPNLVPDGPRRIDPNRFFLSGRVRLPDWAQSGPSEQSSAVPEGETFDVSVDIDRADLFFFRYIFEERVSKIRGYTAGSLHIGGRFRDPVFDADLTIENGAVNLPLFGLRYEVDGPVEVDRRGIHPRGLSVRDDEGTATIDGSILFNDYQYFSFDLSATLNELTVIDVSQAGDLAFYGDIRASGPLRLTGPLSDATLASDAARTTPDSELYIPVRGQSVEEDAGFIVFADSTGRAPNVETFPRRQNILADRPEGVPTFVEGLNLDLNITAPQESTVNLVFDPIVGDVVTAVGSGRVQLQRQEGEFSVFGSFEATSGTYLFTAGEVFVRRFSIAEGTITWDGDPTNARLDLNAEYSTRASPSGLPGYENYRGRIPVTVKLDITGRVATPQVNLSLALTRTEERNLVGSETLDAILNQPARTTEYATSVLLTNTFLLTTESITQQGGTDAEGANDRLTSAGNQLAFNSVSQLVSSQLNRYLGQALPNVDLNFGVQGEDPDNLDLIYGVALRLLNERLVIRGEGVYTSDDTDTQRPEGPQGEFVVEVRLSSRVSAKVFYRRTGDELTRNQSLTSSRGAGVSYQTQFSTWRVLFNRLFGWLLPSTEETEDEPPGQAPVADETSTRADSTSTSAKQR